MQVLVVEDECLIRMLVCDLLEEAGYTCVEAADATEALALLAGGLCQPSILVSDFNLGPGLNGQALAGEALRRLPGLAVVFMTGNPEAFDEYPLRPWERLIAKPFAGADLVEAIRELRPPSKLQPRTQPASDLAYSAQAA
jgi:CheY-like chemotaxis protein